MKVNKMRNNTLEKKEKIFLTCTLLTFLVIFIVLSQLLPMLLWDENAYLSNARSHTSSSAYTEDYKFPLLEWNVSLLWSIFGESLTLAKLLAIAFTLGTIALTYIFGRRYLSFKYAALLTTLFAFSPLIMYWGFRVYSDIPAMFFVLLSFLLILKYDDTKNNWYFVAASIFAAFAFLERFTQGIFTICVLAYYLYKKDIKKIFIFAAIFLVTLSPWLIYNQINYNNPVWDLQEQYILVQAWTSPEPAINQVSNLFTFNNPLIPLFMLAGVFYFLKKEKFSVMIVLYTSISFIYYIFFVNTKDSRYYLSFLPFIYLLAVYLLTIMNKAKNIRVRNLEKFIYHALIILSAFVLLIHAGHIFSDSYCQKNQSVLKSIEYLGNAGYYGHNATIISNAWPWYGYYLDANVSSSWDNNITRMVHNMNADYVTYTNIIGIEYNKNTLDDSTSLELEKTFKGNCNDITYVYKVKK